MENIQRHRRIKNRDVPRDNFYQSRMKALLKKKEEACETEEELMDFYKEEFGDNVSSKDVQSIVSMIMEERALEKSKEWLFITINPDPKKVGMDVRAEGPLRSALFKMFKSVQLDQLPCIYAFDQRSADTDPQGLHVHMMINRRKPSGEFIKPYLVESTIRRCVKDLIGNSQHVKVLKVTTEGDKERFINYVKGIKSRDKQPIALKTSEWLENSGLENFYTRNWEDSTIEENGKTETEFEFIEVSENGKTEM